MGYKLLLTDNQSALGHAIRRALDDYPYVKLCPSADTIEHQDDQALSRYLDKQHPGFLLNTLACTGTLPRFNEQLADLCGQRKMICMHLSSYRVFGTTACQGQGFGEADTPRPDDLPGQQLLAAENAFLTNSKSLVLRLPWLVEARGDNIFTRVASGLTGQQPLQVSDMHRGCPTTVDDVARVVVAMILQIFCGAENWGIFHLRTSDSCSEAEFADHVSRLLSKEGARPGPIEISHNQNEPLIPGCGLLEGSRCTNNFGIQLRSWRHGLKAVVKEWLENQPQIQSDKA